MRLQFQSKAFALLSLLSACSSAHGRGEDTSVGDAGLDAVAVVDARRDASRDVGPYDSGRDGATACEAWVEDFREPGLSDQEVIERAMEAAPATCPAWTMHFASRTYEVDHFVITRTGQWIADSGRATFRSHSDEPIVATGPSTQVSYFLFLAESFDFERVDSVSSKPLIENVHAPAFAIGRSTFRGFAKIGLRLAAPQTEAFSVYDCEFLGDSNFAASGVVIEHVTSIQNFYRNHFRDIGFGPEEAAIVFSSSNGATVLSGSNIVNASTFTNVGTAYLFAGSFVGVPGSQAALTVGLADTFDGVGVALRVAQLIPNGVDLTMTNGLNVATHFTANNLTYHPRVPDSPASVVLNSANGLDVSGGLLVDLSPLLIRGRVNNLRIESSTFSSTLPNTPCIRIEGALSNSTINGSNFANCPSGSIVAAPTATLDNVTISGNTFSGTQRHLDLLSATIGAGGLSFCEGNTFDASMLHPQDDLRQCREED